jgi:class 3 adenylate cyclase
MRSLLSWLQSIGLERHARALQDSGVDLDIIGNLTEQDLRELGLNLGDRRPMVAAIASLQATVPAAPSSDLSPGPAERRQLTVLFCDLVGSTELSQKLDPEELRRLIRAYHDACAAAVSPFQGCIAQYLGDGVVVYFGYAQSHEGEAERAVRAGLRILERVPEVSPDLRVRIGIDTGLVVVGQGGSVSELDRMATGDAPNVAARLQVLARPGTMVISDRTRQVAAGAFDYVDLGAHDVKGVAAPLRLWEVTGEKALETRFDAHTGGTTSPMEGRDIELDVALHAWSHAEGAISRCSCYVARPVSENLAFYARSARNSRAVARRRGSISARRLMSTLRFTRQSPTWNVHWGSRATNLQHRALPGSKRW